MAADIYSIRVDGTGLVRLTTDRKSFLPRYSPDGTKILFLSCPDLFVDSTNLNRMNADGSGREVLVTDASSMWGSLFYRNFAQSPDGSSICYCKPGRQGGTTSGHTNLILYSFATRNRARVAPSDTLQISNPGFSFDGRRVYYEDRSGENAGVYSVAIDGTGTQRQYLSPSANFRSSCSPLDERLVVTEGTDIFIVKSGGTLAGPLAREVDNHYPALFSPDGARVLYLGYTDTIATVSVDGGAPVNLAAGYMPAFSVDGRTILFLRDGGYTLCSMDADGTSQKVLLKSSVPIQDPSFSPDGIRIVFWQ
jgi:Tol biopolymer transport system component